MEEKPKIRVSPPKKTTREMEEKPKIRVSPPKNPTRKREEKLKIRVTAKKLRFYGRLEREKKERERRKYARSHIYNKKETGALPR